MDSLRRWLRVMMGFSRREANSFLIILPLLLGALFLPALWYQWRTARKPDFSQEHAKLDSLAAHLDAVAAKTGSRDDNVGGVDVERPLFVFDPNQVTYEQLCQLGLSAPVARHLIAYRAKGGHFKVKSDLLKIYGLDTSLYRKLYSYVILPEERDSKQQKWDSGTKEWTAKPALPVRTVVKFDLNVADTAQLISIRGIGPVLAKRILKYREKLGGYVRADQLHEVYGLDSTVVNTLKATCYLGDTFQPRKINLNESNEWELSSHPYISKGMAKAIVAYRFQHGAFNSVEDIAKIPLIDQKTFQRLLPYVVVKL